MHDQTTRAAHLAAIAQHPSPAPTFAEVGSWMVWSTAHLAAACEAPEPASGSEERTPALVVRGWRFARTCVHAAKLLPTVRRAVPWYCWPILGLAAAVKCLPLDFGTDEALFAIAFALIAWRRPGLLKALYREAQAGKPATCRCGQCAPSIRYARKAVAV